MINSILMVWNKKGMIYKPDPTHWWAQNYGLLPTPDYISEENKIRIYYSTTDEHNFGRICYLDVSPDKPKEIINNSKQPVLDLGQPGNFDDCGLAPCCIATIDENKYLFYFGYQRSYQIPFLLFAGMAKIEGDHLKRVKTTPVLDRIPGEETIRSSCFVLREEGKYRMWYSSALYWEKFKSGIHAGRNMPVYVIKYAESKSGFHWDTTGIISIGPSDEDEFGFSRPWVIKEEGKYKMWYSVRRRYLSYRIGYAESLDGLKWQRKDKKMGLSPSDDGWDSEMICYPAVIGLKDKYLMFYNGNGNGASGFGFAELRK